MARPRAFTLVELLIVVVLMGIAGALVIPQMGTVGSLRVQGALRTVVSDITFAQADAIAFQERRAVVFDLDASSYSLVQVLSGEIDPAANTLYEPSRPGGRFVADLADPRFGGARITRADFNGGPILVFDDVGAPVADASSDAPGTGGVVTILGADSSWDIVVEPFTGRVSVRQVEAAVAPIQAGAVAPD